MANPRRDTTAGHVYNDLRNLARRTRRSTDEIMVEYVLERFLYRLAASPLGSEHFVLKGGLLPAQFSARRMTRDRDYGDLYRLLTLNNLDGQELTTALTTTAAHRGITLKPLSTAITGLGERRQTSYTA
nr:hypothetical protein OG999_16635 [Streptomyces sp. NBC_00886]